MLETQRVQGQPSKDNRLSSLCIDYIQRRKEHKRTMEKLRRESMTDEQRAWRNERRREYERKKRKQSLERYVAIEREKEIERSAQEAEGARTSQTVEENEGSMTSPNVEANENCVKGCHANPNVVVNEKCGKGCHTNRLTYVKRQARTVCLTQLKHQDQTMRCQVSEGSSNRPISLTAIKRLARAISTSGIAKSKEDGLHLQELQTEGNRNSQDKNEVPGCQRQLSQDKTNECTITDMQIIDGKPMEKHLGDLDEEADAIQRNEQKREKRRLAEQIRRHMMSVEARENILAHRRQQRRQETKLQREERRVRDRKRRERQRETNQNPSNGQLEGLMMLASFCMESDPL